MGKKNINNPMANIVFLFCIKGILADRIGARIRDRT